MGSHFINLQYRLQLTLWLTNPKGPEAVSAHHDHVELWLGPEEPRREAFHCHVDSRTGKGSASLPCKPETSSKTGCFGKTLLAFSRGWKKEFYYYHLIFVILKVREERLLSVRYLQYNKMQKNKQTNSISTQTLK